MSLSLGRTSVEPATFFQDYLMRGGVWNPANTGGRMPIVVREELLRRVNLTRSDIVTVRFDAEEPEAVALGYTAENDLDRGIFRIFTRVSIDQVHLMKEELKRCLQDVRVRPFGVMAGQGADWLKVTRVTKAERTSRALWKREVHVEVMRRYRPILTNRD